MFYAFLIRDWFVYIPNMAGLMFGWFFTFSCFKFSKDEAQDMITAIILGTAVLFFIIGLIHQAFNMQFDAAKKLWWVLGAGYRGRCGMWGRLPAVAHVPTSSGCWGPGTGRDAWPLLLLRASGHRHVIFHLRAHPSGPQYACR